MKNGTPGKIPEGGRNGYLRFGAGFSPAVRWVSLIRCYYAGGVRRVYGKDKLWNEQERHQRTDDLITAINTPVGLTAKNHTGR